MILGTDILELIVLTRIYGHPEVFQRVCQLKLDLTDNQEQLT